ncbi:methyl-accepting chemotaxis protein, partial [Aeromonas hydrophila]
QYRLAASEILASLSQLGHQRQGYVEQGSSRLLEGLTLELEGMAKQANQLQALPLLGIYEQPAADEFTLGEPERKEIG